MTKRKWREVTVDPKGAGHTYRLRVPGGWLYRTVTYRYPELHSWYENSSPSDRKQQRDRVLERAVEIVAQNVVFVPEQERWK